MPADHTAVDSTLGYVFQTLRALVILLQAADDQNVTLELSDDVTLHHSPAFLSEKRYQIAHSIQFPLAELTIKSVKLWKTIGIWASTFNRNEYYFLLTCAPVSSNLKCLTSTDDRAAIQSLLEEEAKLVVSEVQQGTHLHKERLSSCKAFLDLDSKTRADLLNRIQLCADIPNITEIDAVLEQELRNLARPEKRQQMIKRLREYWMNRCCLSLTGEMPRHITKAELLEKIEELANAIAGKGLPDDYGIMQPPTDQKIPDQMRRQIEIVNGGTSRLNRAKTAYWKSRNQRQKWLDDDVSLASQLNHFDKKLIEMWQDRHGPMCDDCKDSAEREKQQRGCELLDWSHNDAPLWPISIGQGRVPTYVTQGTYQDLATCLLVGWHPQYKDILSSNGEAECEQ